MRIRSLATVRATQLLAALAIAAQVPMLVLVSTQLGLRPMVALGLALFGLVVVTLAYSITAFRLLDRGDSSLLAGRVAALLYWSAMSGVFSLMALLTSPLMGCVLTTSYTCLLAAVVFFQTRISERYSDPQPLNQAEVPD